MGNSYFSCLIANSFFFFESFVVLDHVLFISDFCIILIFVFMYLYKHCFQMSDLGLECLIPEPKAHG